MFITFEGIDGSGKTTQAEMLKNYLASAGFGAVMYREPGGTELGEIIRQQILERPELGLDIRTKVLLYNAARVELVRRKIKPSLRNGWIVICDRYYHSTIAYQCCGDGENLQDVGDIIEYSIGGVRPDMTIFLNTPITKALLRAQDRDRPEGVTLTRPISHKQFTYYDKVRKGYMNLWETENDYWIYLDYNNKSKGEVHGEILEIVMPKISERHKSRR